MKLGMYLSAILLGSAALTGVSNAAPVKSGETFQYNAAKLQSACKGKSQGSPVSMAMNGVIFNGTCEVQYMPNARMTSFDPAETAQACSGQQANAMVKATVDGKEMAGKCVLAYKNIGPDNQ